MHRLVPRPAGQTGEAQPLAPPPATSHALVARPAAPAGGGISSCPHRAEPCPALAALLGPGKSGSSPEALVWIARVRPCETCRISFDARRRSLRGLRLGRHERDILSGAAPYDVLVVTAAGMTRSLSAARRRAAQTLIRAGLLSLAPRGGGDGEAGPPSQARTAVALTPMGRYVLAAFGRYIRGGKPVRWTRPAAGTALPGAEPASLAPEALELARAELHATLVDLKKVLLAAVARPVRDSDLLEKVTLQLQAKAQGLRDLLEPADSVAWRSDPVAVSARARTAGA